jgi:hypothetical protein
MLLNVLLPANSNNISSVIDSAKSSYFAVNNSNLTDFCPADYMSDESKWSWPKLTENELENAIFSSSNKKASESDKIDFLII